jgi:hypothetical protein
MSGCDNSNIRKNYIVSGVEIDILSACTGFYTDNIYNCSGDTLTLHSDIYIVIMYLPIQLIHQFI